MNHLLAIDIGNTNIAVGVFKDASLIKKIKIPTHNHSMYERCLNRLLNKFDIEDVVISSVVPEALSKLKKVLHRISDSRISIVGEDIKAPIKNLYKVKTQVGQDRLVNAFAAKNIYGSPCVIIDFGTAITFDIVSNRGEYLGGLILPGMEMSLSGLYEKTALLPKVKLRPSHYIIGKDTVNSIRGGILFGFGSMCDALISKYRKILGNGVKVIATGGNAELMKKYTKVIQIVDENLTLKGLFLISRL